MSNLIKSIKSRMAAMSEDLIQKIEISTNENEISSLQSKHENLSKIFDIITKEEQKHQIGKDEVLSIRDQFAIQAMRIVNSQLPFNTIAKDSYRIADQMMKIRQSTN